MTRAATPWPWISIEAEGGDLAVERAERYRRRGCRFVRGKWPVGKVSGGDRVCGSGVFDGEQTQSLAEPIVGAEEFDVENGAIVGIGGRTEPAWVPVRCATFPVRFVIDWQFEPCDRAFSPVRFGGLAAGVVGDVGVSREHPVSDPDRFDRPGEEFRRSLR